MKLTKQRLIQIIKEELQRETFKYSASNIANALQGAGATGDQLELEEYIRNVLNNPSNPPRMPGKYSSEVFGHKEVAAAIRELIDLSGGRGDSAQIEALANEIGDGIRSRNRD